uniref:zinc finger protein 184 n=1 Tax=Scatophagus argus TaxID=75038 RepID=UPI001ED80816|nr:zinc finger protein 184 [Scatophagus argus]XP_046264604.1 zinc finger protein 184 [Scatophagus argus]
MENRSFHSQLLSVMEVLAKAAVAEIKRRVDDSCAVLRLEVTESRRDIDLLKRKCALMETELSRTRRRTGRSVKVVLDKERQITVWDRLMDAEAQNQPQPRADQADHILIKDMWKNNPEDTLVSEAEQCSEASQPTQTVVEPRRSAENPVDPGSLVFPADGYNTFPEQQLNRKELVVKRERDDEEPDENAAPLDSAHEFAAEEGDGPFWLSNQCRDGVAPSRSRAGQQFGPIPSVFLSQTGSRSAVVSTARVKRQQPQHQHGDSAPHTRNSNKDSTPPNTAATSLHGHGRGSFGLARRTKTPWMSGIGEKRFSCTYCNKGFVRFSQLGEHLRSHTGEKPFSCLQCGRSFTKQCNLIRHAVVHSGEKPFECSLCGKSFTQRSSLKSHQKTAH